MTSVIEVHDLTKGERQRSRSGWLAITGLLLLSALPVLGPLRRTRPLLMLVIVFVVMASQRPERKNPRVR